MKRRSRGLFILLLLAPTFNACNRDDPTSVPAVAPRVDTNQPGVLRDAVVFFTRQFSPVEGGLAVMNADGSGRRPLPGGERGFDPAISPDGRQIVFERVTNPGTSDIFIMNSDGSGTTLLVQGMLFNSEPTWSPDGCQIAFRSQHQGNPSPFGIISIINADGTGRREVTPPFGPDDFAFDGGPSFSPDGKRLVFTRNLALHVINVDGTGFTRLPNEDMAGNPAWSPDGKRIAYWSFDPPGDIHVRNADGSNMVAVTTTPEFEFWPRWSPDGRQLVISRVIGDRIAVVKINADGTGDATTLTPEGVDDFVPDWGRRSSSTSRCTPGIRLEVSPTVVPIGLSRTRQLTATARLTSGDVLDHPPVAWSSSNEAVATVTQTGLVTAVGLGQVEVRAAFGDAVALAQINVVDLVLRNAIVYATEEFGAGVSQLVIVRPDGSGRARLTTDGRIYLSPDISPDGRRIAVASATPFGGAGIFVMDADGSGVTPVVERAGDSEPAWSPDGTRIAFVSNNDGPFGPVTRVFVVNLDGTGLRQLTPEDPDPNLWFYESNPSWSPDGSKVLVVRNTSLHVINADGTGLTQLPNDDLATSADWSPDGARIAYSNQFGDIAIRNADGSNRVTVTFNSDLETSPRWSPDGGRIVFCRRVEGSYQLFIINADGSGEAKLSANPNANECPASWSPLP